MIARTYSVKGGYIDRDGRRWVYVNTNPPRAIQTDESIPDDAAVRIVRDRAVRA